MWEWVFRVGVVPTCTLKQCVNSLPPFALGECAEFDGVITVYTPSSGRTLFSHSPQGANATLRHTGNIVPVSMRCECVWARVEVRWGGTIQHSRAVCESYPNPHSTWRCISSRWVYVLFCVACMSLFYYIYIWKSATKQKLNLPSAGEAG